MVIFHCYVSSPEGIWYGTFLAFAQPGAQQKIVGENPMQPQPGEKKKRR